MRKHFEHPEEICSFTLLQYASASIKAAQYISYTAPIRLSR